MFFEPKNFARSEAGKNRVAEFLDRAFQAAQLAHDLVALFRCRCVAPQLGWTNDLAFFIKRHETVLLAADPDGSHFAGRGLGLLERSANAGLGSVDPVGGMLFLGSGGEAFDQAVSLGAFAKNLAVFCVHNQCLGGLCAAIDADD